MTTLNIVCIVSFVWDWRQDSAKKASENDQIQQKKNYVSQYQY